MAEPIHFDDLVTGDIFYIEDPYRQYYVKLEPFEVNGRQCNAEELESGKPVRFRPSPRFPIFPDDGRASWNGPVRRLVETNELDATRFVKLLEAYEVSTIRYDEQVDMFVVYMAPPGPAETIVHYVDDFVGLIYTAENREVIGFQVEAYKEAFVPGHASAYDAWRLSDFDTELGELEDLILYVDRRLLGNCDWYEPRVRSMVMMTTSAAGRGVVRARWRLPWEWLPRNPWICPHCKKV